MLVDNIGVLSPLGERDKARAAPLERAQSQRAVQAQRAHTGAPSVAGQRNLRKPPPRLGLFYAQRVPKSLSLPLREKDRIRGKPHTLRAGIGFPRDAKSSAEIGIVMNCGAVVILAVFGITAEEAPRMR